MEIEYEGDPSDEDYQSSYDDGIEKQEMEW